MAITLSSSKIENRRREIASAIERLRAEDTELEIALRVIQRFESDTGRVVSSVAAQSDMPSDEREPKLGPRRPSGCPTNYEMVDMILAGAEKEGTEGLTLSEITSEIRKRYWPGLKDAQVAAPIYAFVRSGRFRKLSNGRLGRVKKDEGSTAGGPQSLL
jgi:hypothetical protein